MSNDHVPFMVEEALACAPVLSPPPAEAKAPGRPEIDWRDHLTPAERRVLHHLLTGSSNKDIADALGRSEATIKNQVAAIYQKSGIHSRGRLIAEWNRRPSIPEPPASITPLH